MSIPDPIQVQIDHNITATFKLWNAEERTGKLLLWAHGMQDPSGFEKKIKGEIKDYAFTVPFDKALNNTGFTGTNTRRIKEAFLRFSVSSFSFSSEYVPFLHIYGFIQDSSIEKALDSSHREGLPGDILLIDDVTGADTITLSQLLNAQCPYQADGRRTFKDLYSSYLLLTCRSSAKRGLGIAGVGGKAEAYIPDGLYHADTVEKGLPIPIPPSQPL